jgi:hypothetical protein
MGFQPMVQGQNLSRYGHDLVAVESQLPRDKLVWKCKDCEARATDSKELAVVECE